MPITEFPTKTVGSIGPVKTDTRAYLNTGTELPSVELEKIKDALIELYNEVGLSDGSTEGSLNADPISDLLWRWNGVDLTELDTGTPIQGEDDGNAESGSAAAAVTTDVHGAPIIQLTATALEGFWLLPLLPSSFDQGNSLPRKFVVEVELGVLSNVSLFPLIGLCVSDDVEGGARGICWEAIGNSATTRLRGLLDDGIDITDTLGTQSPGTYDTAAQHVNFRVRIEVELYAGEDLGYRIKEEIRSQDGISFGGNASGNAGDMATTGYTGDMDKIAIGFWAASVQSGTLDITDIRIYKHPLDRT